MWKAILLTVALILGSTDKALSQTATTPANVYVDGACICVTSGYCNLAGGGGGSATDGSGQIDPRIMTVTSVYKRFKLFTNCSF